MQCNDYIACLALSLQLVLARGESGSRSRSPCRSCLRDDGYQHGTSTHHPLAGRLRDMGMLVCRFRTNPLPTALFVQSPPPFNRRVVYRPACVVITDEHSLLGYWLVTPFGFADIGRLKDSVLIPLVRASSCFIQTRKH